MDDKSAEALQKLLETQVQELATGLRQVAGLYMSWYTFFVALNLAGLGATSTAGITVLIPIFLGLNVFGSIGCLIALLYFRSTCLSIQRKREDLWRHVLNEQAEASMQDHMVAIFPIRVFTWTATVNLLGLVGFWSVWGYLLLR